MRKSNIFRPVPFYLTYKFFFLLYTAIIALEMFLVFSENLPKPRVDPTSDVSIFGALFSVFTGRVPQTDGRTARNCEVLKGFIVYAAWLSIIAIQFSLPFLFIYRGIFIRRRLKSIKDFCLMDRNLIEQLNKKKRDYSEANRHKIEDDAKYEVSNLLTLKVIPVLSGLNHPNFLLENIPDNTPHTTLKHFMMGDIMWSFCWGFIIMIRYTNDVLKGVQYLHERNIYHLDLQPANILIMNTKSNDKGNIAKIGNFEFAKICPKKKIPVDKVGLSDFYRPPECFISKEVDPEKVDCWSVGITAYELFTGGILSVEADLSESKSITCVELLKKNSLLEQRYFSSSLEACWGPLDFLDFLQVMMGHFCMLYDLNDAELVPDCWNFVRALLHFDPKLRINIQRALNTPLIRKVHSLPPGRPRRKVYIV